MLLLKTDGLKTSYKITVNKGISGLIISSPSDFNALNKDIEISLMVERANGANYEITNGFLNLKQFIVASTAMADQIVFFEELNVGFCATLELTELGAIHLYEKDNIIIELRGIPNGVSAPYFHIFGIEEPITTDTVFSFERKNMASETTNQDFDVTGFEMVLLTGLDKSPNEDKTQLALTYDNGVIVNYTPFELCALFATVDPIVLTAVDYSLCDHNDYLILPLEGIINLQIRKDPKSGILMLLKRS